ncbi:MAG: hypothetical protein ACR2IN_07650 [Thermoleophilaceae bacterium]
MDALRRLYRWLVRRLPPRAAWTLWRAAMLAARRRRGRVAGPPIASAHVAWGASEGELAALVKRLMDGPENDPARLLVITDCDAVHVAAARGVRLEHVPPSEEWRRRSPDGDYDAFLERRLRSILASYRIASLDLSPGTPVSIARTASEAGVRLTTSG